MLSRPLMSVMAKEANGALVRNLARVYVFDHRYRVGVLENPHAASCMSGGVSSERPGYDTNLGCVVRYWAEGKYERHHHRRREHGAGHRTPAGGWGPFGNDRGQGPG